MNASEIIDKLGGPTAVAKLLNVKPPSVHAWKTGGIPDDKLIRLAPTLEKAGIATRRELRPNDWQQIWPELVDQSAPEAEPQ
ncbi:transcriptional regulator [Massilia varians]|uniref:transcriptional regulator n=1 Tax=Massilia varians TaxID=457921 RepID=UPI0025551C3A|nr:YdaS family helix-turn-helix protein [Massilia varians]MDK6077917.1 YdaS family helix-turn-helix protein [Massilia varians]